MSSLTPPSLLNAPPRGRFMTRAGKLSRTGAPIMRWNPLPVAFPSAWSSSKALCAVA